ncbi:MAG: hypothetical protein IKT05_05635 [Fibrobacter sp.]|nr:hypothetical protein [Fibrobacter sp.]
MLKKLCLVGLAATAFSFAQEETFIRNICDSLPASATPKVGLKLDRVEETIWYGSRDLKKSDSVKVNRHADYSTITPIIQKMDLRIPYSVDAGCTVSNYNLFKYGEWGQNSKKWSLNDENDDYGTWIIDVNINKIAGFDSSNSYNVLVVKKGGIPEELSFSSNELMVSKTFEFAFESWQAIVVGRVKRVTETEEVTSLYSGSAYRLDSAEAVTAALAAFNKNADVPDSLSKIQVQVLRPVLADPNKKVANSSSSVAVSSSSEAKSSSSDASSSSAKSSSSVAPSSSESAEAIGPQQAKPRTFGMVRAVRRLDGSQVKAGEQLVPGVYYVKGVDGRWKKQVELP